MTTHSQFPSGFYRLTRAQRAEYLSSIGLITAAERKLLESSTHPDCLSVCDHLSENTIGAMPLPLGLITQLPMDDVIRTIPMAIEESSVIAGLNHAAKTVNQHGQLRTLTISEYINGQIHLPRLGNTSSLQQQLARDKQLLIAWLNETVMASMAARGGGVINLALRVLGDGHGVIDLLLDSVDAMGANQVTQACEALRAKLVEEYEQVCGMAIVSNLSDQCLVQAELLLTEIDPTLGQAIAEASHFAQLDPYRAATHNKGIFNGIDAVLIATGNDWRAVEAGGHAYAARDGQYRGLSKWIWRRNQLLGSLTLPCPVGIVGGATRLHPICKLALKIMAVDSAKDLGRICAAVGLLQNFAALKVLCSEGLIQGHMRLHIENLLLAVQAEPEEHVALRAALTQHLNSHGRISESDAHTALAKLRSLAKDI